MIENQTRNTNLKQSMTGSQLSRGITQLINEDAAATKGPIIEVDEEEYDMYEPLLAGLKDYEQSASF